MRSTDLKRALGGSPARSRPKEPHRPGVRRSADALAGAGGVQRRSDRDRARPDGNDCGYIIGPRRHRAHRDAVASLSLETGVMRNSPRVPVGWPWRRWILGDRWPGRRLPAELRARNPLDGRRHRPQSRQHPQTTDQRRRLGLNSVPSTLTGARLSGGRAASTAVPWRRERRCCSGTVAPGSAMAMIGVRWPKTASIRDQARAVNRAPSHRTGQPRAKSSPP